MLGSIRKKTKGWLAYTIIGLIIVPFALFGVAEYSTGISNIVVATIDGDEVSREEFLSRFNRQKRALQEQLGERYTVEFDNNLKRSTIGLIINERLLAKLAEELGYTTIASELQTIIQANNDFKVNGQFSLDRYKQLLRLNGYNDIQYETAKLAELTQRQIKQNLLNSAFMGASALKQMQSLNDQQREFNYIQFNTNDYIPKVVVDAKRVEDFYEKQKTSFFEPEQVKLDFIELSLKEIAKDIKVSDEELLSFYDDEEERFTSDEERQAQHILLADKDTANKVLNLLNTGGNFVQLASEYSQDSGSKDNAGDLGFFTRGVMLPEFEAQVFDMKEGALSGLVKSELGYHIIKLNKIEYRSVKSFDSVKVELLDLYTQEEAKKIFYKLTEQLANLAYEASFEEVAEQMNLKLQTTEFFNRNNTTLDKKILTAGFSDTVLNKGENSQVLELSKDKVAVVRLKQKLPQRQKTFNEVKTQINTRLTALAAQTFVNKTAEEIATALRKGDDKTAKQIMEKHQLSWQRIGWVERISNKADTAIIEQVFILPKPSADKVIYGATSINSDAVVIELSGVKETSSDVVNRGLESTLLQIESDEMFKAILTTLHKNSVLEVFTNRF